MSHLMGGLETLVPISITVNAKRKSEGEKWGQVGSSLNFFCSFPDTITIWRPGSRAAQPWLQSTRTCRETGHRRNHITSLRWLRKEITGDGTSWSRVWSKIKKHDSQSIGQLFLLPTPSLKLCLGEVQRVHLRMYVHSRLAVFGLLSLSENISPSVSFTSAGEARLKLEAVF